LSIDPSHKLASAFPSSDTSIFFAKRVATDTPSKGQHGGAFSKFPYLVFLCFVQCCHTSRQRPSTQHGHGFSQPFFIFLFLATSPQRMYQPPLIMRLLFFGSPFEAFANTQEEEEKS
jgi:hypothetical protein